MANGQKAVNLALSLKGKNQYTQSSRREEVFAGYSDCSSLLWKIFEKVYGIYIGSWTGEQVRHGRQLIVRDRAVPYAKMTQREIDQMQPGDLIFYGAGDAYHVEMYMGDGKQIGHGSGWGPTVKNTLEYAHPRGFYQVRRYLGDDSAAPAPSPETEGSRLFVGKVTATELNVRSWYGRDEDGAYYPRIKSYPVLKKGNLVDVLEAYDFGGETWYKIRIAGNYIGFAAGTYIKRQ